MASPWAGLGLLPQVDSEPSAVMKALMAKELEEVRVYWAALPRKRLGEQKMTGSLNVFVKNTRDLFLIGTSFSKTHGFSGLWSCAFRLGFFGSAPFAEAFAASPDAAGPRCLDHLAGEVALGDRQLEGGGGGRWRWRSVGGWVGGDWFGGF